MGRRDQEKYAKAINALRKIAAGNRDKASDGTPLPPKVLKTLDPTFSSIPLSSWRKKVSEVRAYYSISAMAIAANTGTFACYHSSTKNHN